MSFGICRVDKVKTASGIAGIQIHDRQRTKSQQYKPGIDFSRSSCNYSFVDVDFDKYDSYNDYINQQIKARYTGSKAIRKDAVKMIDVIFTSDSDFFADKTPEQIRTYFHTCLDFARRRWGVENIVSAIVHLDEKTPHLHLNFIPLTKDGRLSAKDILGGKKELQQLQDDFYTEIAKQFGLERGLRADLNNPNDIPKKHKTVTEYKREKQAEELEQRVETAQKQAEHIENINEIVHTAEAVVTLFGKSTGYVKMPEAEFVKLKKAAKGYDEDRTENKSLKALIDRLNDEIKKMAAQISDMAHRMVNCTKQLNLFKRAFKMSENTTYDDVLHVLTERGFFQKAPQKSQGHKKI